MSERNELLTKFMDTLDPQARFNMEVAVQVDALLRAGSGDEEPPSWFDNRNEEEPVDILSRQIDRLTDEVDTLKSELKILRGALEETINQLREVQKGRPRETADATVGATQTKARQSQPKRVRGLYCRFCGKKLEGTYQTIFCSRGCAGRWQGQHKGEVATPRMSLDDKNNFKATVEASVGVKKGSVAA